jgi:DNA-binding Xre family transcriptional regulator
MNGHRAEPLDTRLNQGALKYYQVILFGVPEKFMSSTRVFEALKMYLKARGITYAHLARTLDISEATVKRMFSEKNCTLARLEQICDVVQIDLAELARTMPRGSRLIHRLSKAQEDQLIADPKLFLVAVSAMNHMRIDEIVSTYRISETQCLSLLLRLEKIGFLEVHENNRIRLRVSRAFAWIPAGPIMRYVKAQTSEYFKHSFDASGEFMRIVNVRVSEEARAALLSRIEQIAREYSDQHDADSHLPLAQRRPLSVLLAVRSWEPAMFKSLRRSKA